MATTTGILTSSIEDTSNIVNSSQIREEWNEVSQFRVVRIVEPRGNWDSIVGMEDVGSGGVVKDNCVPYGPSELGEVLNDTMSSISPGDNAKPNINLDVVPSMVVATLPEQAMCDCMADVEPIQHWICVLCAND